MTEQPAARTPTRPSEEVPSQSQSDRVYDELRAAILTLDVLPGTSLSERGVEARFDASRTPSRAALQRLQTEGLVERVGRRWRVTAIDLEDLRQVSNFRLVLETAAIRWAVASATTEEIDRLGERAGSDTRCDRPALSDNRCTVETILNGEQLHLELARLTGNRYLVEALSGTLTRLARSRWLVVVDQSARATAHAAHTRILDALRARDPEVAVAAMEEHLHHADKVVITRLKQDAQHHRLRGADLTS